jgi:hypothetical protein
MQRRCAATLALVIASIFSIYVGILTTGSLEDVQVAGNSTQATSFCTSKMFGICVEHPIRAYLPALISSASGNGKKADARTVISRSQSQRNNSNHPAGPAQDDAKVEGKARADEVMFDAREWILDASCPEATKNSTEPNLKTARHIRLAKPAENSTNSRFMCVTYAHHKRHDRARAEKQTWAKRCDGHIVSSDSTDESISAVNISHAGKENYYNMWQKTRSTIKYVHEHHKDDYDWFYFAGDDVYVFMENLRAYLASENFTKAVGDNFTASTPVFVGGMMHGHRVTYIFGGSGYLLNRAGLALFANKIYPSCSVDDQTDAEDLLITQCMRRFGARIPDTLDFRQRSRFARFSPQIFWYVQNKFVFNGVLHNCEVFPTRNVCVCTLSLFGLILESSSNNVDPGGRFSWYCNLQNN